MYNNGKLVPITHKDEVRIYEPTRYEHNLLNYEGKTYRLVDIDDFKDRKYINADKLATVSYRRNVTAFGKTFVVVNSDGNHVELLSQSKVQLTSKCLKYECIIDGIYFDMIELKDYHKKIELPTKSNFQIIYKPSGK